MTQSVPSRMAFATSEVSARVGWGFSIMLSSIWVAVITGVSAQWQASMIIFWSSGTFSGRHLHAQVAAGDHDAVGFADDLLEVQDGLGLLDLRDDRDVRLQRLDEETGLRDVLCRAHERERDVINALLDAEPEVVLVLVRQRGKRELRARED